MSATERTAALEAQVAALRAALAQLRAAAQELVEDYVEFIDGDFDRLRAALERAAATEEMGK